jgi:predicted nuclease with RNAse H fold
VVPKNSVPNIKQLYIGIDVAFAKKKRLPICAAYLDGKRLTPLRLDEYELPVIPRGSGNVASLQSDIVAEFANAVGHYLRSLECKVRTKIKVVAIDAPSDYSSGGARKSEAGLRKAGISCFSTPSAERFEEIREKVRKHLSADGAENRLPHAMQLWMLVGFALFRELEKHYNCIEVFPQAIAHRLNAADIHKFRKEGLAAQLRAMSAATGWEPGELASELKICVAGAPHDRLDAYMCAWVASLYPELDVYGGEPNDSIWVPRQRQLKSKVRR